MNRMVRNFLKIIHTCVLYNLVMLTGDCAAANIPHAFDIMARYATVMQHETVDRVTPAKECYDHLKNSEETRLKLTKHVMRLSDHPHSITAHDLLSRSSFSRQFIWTLYPNVENGVIVLDNFVKFTQNLYNSQSYVDTIEATDFDDITSKNNAITSLQFLWKLCTSFTPLVKAQIPGITGNVAALAFAIYSIKQGDHGVGNITVENINDHFVDIDMSAIPIENLNEARLQSVRNLIKNVEADTYPFFATVSAALDPFISRYLVPCIIATFSAFEQFIGVDDVHYQVQTKNPDDAFTSFVLKRSFPHARFTTFLTSARTFAANALQAGIASITEAQLTRKANGAGDLRGDVNGASKINVAIKAYSPLFEGPQDRSCFEITSNSLLRQIQDNPEYPQNPFFATFFPSK